MSDVTDGIEELSEPASVSDAGLGSIKWEPLGNVRSSSSASPTVVFITDDAADVLVVADTSTGAGAAVVAAGSGVDPSVALVRDLDHRPARAARNRLASSLRVLLTGTTTWTK